MLREIVSSLGYSGFAEAALVLFALAFGMVLISTLRMSPQTINRYAAMALSDQLEDTRETAAEVGASHE